MVPRCSAASRVRALRRCCALRALDPSLRAPGRSHHDGLSSCAEHREPGTPHRRTVMPIGEMA